VRRTGVGSASITGVAPLPRKQFILELDAEARPIVGSLRDAEGQSIEFIGWLGFSAALGQALTASSQATSAFHGEPRASDRGTIGAARADAP